MKYLKLIFVAIIFTSCSVTSNKKGETEATEWINSHPKPILCHASYMSGLDNSQNYVLTDSKGVVYITEFISVSLPDTIK